MSRLPLSGLAARIASLLLPLLLSPGIAAAGDADDIAKDAQPLAAVEMMKMPAVDHAAALAEDAMLDGPGVPPRFAVARPVKLTPKTDGTWETLADGSKLWRLRVQSPGAVSLNFGFTTYSMPAGGTLVIFTPDAATVLGPYDRGDNKAHRQLWTPIVPGDEAVIEVRLPADGVDRLQLELTAVNHGYREFGALANPDKSGADKSGACNVDVVCPEGDDWDPQIRSVANYSRGGVRLCTGFMVNNTRQDHTPYFMTAFHCGVTAVNAPSMVVYWNYENSTCRPPNSPASGGPGDGSLSQNQTGATWLADSSLSDYTLVMLDDSPNPAFNVHWAGWDVRSIDFPSAIAVHHPRVEEKRISFEDDPVTTTSYLQNASPGDGTHIRVEDWDVGTTEGGSSGSPLFNPDGYVIGQLHGGFAACGNSSSDWYGRMSVSWDLGLKECLDRGNSGTLMQTGLDGVCTAACCPDANTLCLNGGRFKVTVDWRNFEGQDGVASVVPSCSDDSGLLWFFESDNWEMLIKVLNGCGFNDHYWVFAAATTDVEYTLTVEDTQTGEIWSRTNPLGNASPAITDVGAFATCP